MDKAKAAIHRLLKSSPLVRQRLERDAVGMPWMPTDEALKLAYEAGYRAYAAELVSVFNEVEREANGHNS